MTSATASTSLRYGTLAQAFHWLTAILVAAAYLLSPGGSEAHVYSAAADLSRQLHETAGILIFALVFMRLLRRSLVAAPQSPPMPAWMHLAGKAAHVGLYALLFAIPVTGILSAWLEGHSLTLLGASLPPMLPQAHGMGLSLAQLHQILGSAIIWLAGAHAAAALFHHFVLRDGVLASMLPTGARQEAARPPRSDPPHRTLPDPVVAAAELPQSRDSFNLTTLKTASCQFDFPSAVLRK
jgi:cytochrome b561